MALKCISVLCSRTVFTGRKHGCYFRINTHVHGSSTRPGHGQCVSTFTVRTMSGAMLHDVALGVNTSTALCSVYSTHSDFGGNSLSLHFRPLSLPFLLFVPVRTRPPLWLEGLGERISSPSGTGAGRSSPAAKRIWMNFRHKFCIHSIV